MLISNKSDLEALRNDPTAKELARLLLPNELAAERTKGIEVGIEKGIRETKDDLARKLQGLLSQELIQKILG